MDEAADEIEPALHPARVRGRAVLRSIGEPRESQRRVDALPEARAVETVELPLAS